MDGSSVVSERLSLKYSPGILKVVPYTNSAAVQCKSSLSVVRIPSKISGNESVHEMGLLQALIDDFSCRWKHSMMPLAIGWYDVLFLLHH